MSEIKGFNFVKVIYLQAKLSYEKDQKRQNKLIKKIKKLTENSARTKLKAIRNGTYDKTRIY